MKRKFHLFFHNVRVLKRNKKWMMKLRFLSFSCVLFILLVFGLYALIQSYSSYYASSNLTLDVQTALYVLEEGEMSFSIDVDKIIPSDQSYIYTFSISNFNESQQSDVDLEYTMKLQTTTNMPLQYRVYYDHYTLGEVDTITKREVKQDEDGAWYHLFTMDGTYTMQYKEATTHVYYLVIDFPEQYKSDLVYSDAIENIQVLVNSKQIV